MSDEMRFEMGCHPWGDLPWVYRGKHRKNTGNPKIICGCEQTAKNMAAIHQMDSVLEPQTLIFIECKRERFCHRHSISMIEEIFIGKCERCDKVYWYETEYS